MKKFKQQLKDLVEFVKTDKTAKIGLYIIGGLILLSILGLI